MNRFSIIGELVDLSELRHAGPKKTPVITARFKTGVSILKIAYWGKKAIELNEKYSVPGLCFSVVGWLDINSWLYNEKTYAELKGTVDSSHPIETNIELMSNVEIIGAVVKDYGLGNYLVRTNHETKKGKKFVSEFIPFHYSDSIGVGQIIHLIGSLRADTFELNITRQTVDASRIIKF